MAKSISERQISKSPKDDLLFTDHNTIVNIRAHATDQDDSDGDQIAGQDQDLESKVPSKSTRVEYHSDQAISNLTPQRQRRIRSRQKDRINERDVSTQEK